MNDNFTFQQYRAISWCAAECARQQSGEMSVYDMVRAYEFARLESTVLKKPTLYVILRLAEFIEPSKNIHGFRDTPVVINWREIPVTDFSRGLELLLETWDSNPPGIIYREFELMHPFVDGNGRLASILYNWRAAKLEWPVSPPKIEF